MIFWHVGATVAIVRYVFGDPNMDLRFVVIGSLLPDLIDKPIGALIFNEQLRSDRVYGHALLFAAALLVVVMVATKRGTSRRRAWLGLPIGSLLHVFLDGHWAQPDGFWWPFLGIEFPVEARSQLWTLIGDRITDPVTLITEVAGLVYLVYLYRASDLGNADVRRKFLREGKLPLVRSG